MVFLRNLWNEYSALIFALCIIPITMGMAVSANTPVVEQVVPDKSLTVEYNMQLVHSVIKIEEGFKSRPYLDNGYVSIGYGTKLHTSKGMNPADFALVVTRHTAHVLMVAEITKLEQRLIYGEVGHIYNHLSQARQAILISMGYQMGYTGLLGFVNMWNSLEAGYYKAAAADSLDSLWARQTPQRAARHATVMSTNDLGDYK